MSKILKHNVASMIEDYLGSKRHYLYQVVEYSDFSIRKINGVLHRLDGPAVEHLNGKKEYWIFGERYPYFKYKRVIKLLTFK